MPFAVIPRLKIKLQAEVTRKPFEALAKPVDRIVLAGEGNPTAKRDPLHLLQQYPVFATDVIENIAKCRQTGVFAIYVEHQPADSSRDTRDGRLLLHAEPAAASCGIRKIVVRVAYARIHAQADRNLVREVIESLKLRDGIEYNLRCESSRFADVRLRKSDAVG